MSRGFRRSHSMLVAFAELCAQPNSSASLLPTTWRRSMAHLPHQTEGLRDLKLPKRSVVKDAPQAATASPPEVQETSTSSSTTLTPEQEKSAKLHEQGAAAATSMMFPWERRHMDGGPGKLRTWEKYYWGFFVSGLAFLLFSRTFLRGNNKVEEVVDEEKEAQKREMARMALTGTKNFIADDDSFDGMTPQEIQQYVETHVPQEDPYEGLSPEEINALVEKERSGAS